MRYAELRDELVQSASLGCAAQACSFSFNTDVGTLEFFPITDGDFFNLESSPDTGYLTLNTYSLDPE
jgi:hypothetical protein